MAGLAAVVNLGKGKNKEFVVPLDLPKKGHKTGRGGAGNYALNGPQVVTAATERPAYRIPAGREVAVRRRTGTKQKVTTGRGGTGNSKRMTGKGVAGQGSLNFDRHEIEVLSLRQEALRQRIIRSGRGGVGNVIAPPSDNNSPHGSTFDGNTISSHRSGSPSSSTTSLRFSFQRKHRPSLHSSQSFIATPLEITTSHTSSSDTTNNGGGGSLTRVSTSVTDSNIIFATPDPSLYGGAGGGRSSMSSTTGQASIANPECIQMKTFSQLSRTPCTPHIFPEPPPHQASTTSPGGGGLSWRVPVLSRKTTRSTLHKHHQSSPSIHSEWNASPLSQEDVDVINVRRGLKLAQIFGEVPSPSSQNRELTNQIQFPLGRGGDGDDHSESSSASLQSPPPEMHPDGFSESSPHSSPHSTIYPHSPYYQTIPDLSASITPPKRDGSMIALSPPPPLMAKKKEKHKMAKLSRFFRATVVELEQPDWQDFTEAEIADVLNRLRDI